MDLAALAITFPQPEDSLEFGDIVAKAKELFSDKPDVKIYAAVRDAAQQIRALFETQKIEGAVIIGPDCFIQGDVISYMGENYYRSCPEMVHELEDGEKSFCAKRVGHPGPIHEDFDGFIRTEV